WFKEQNIDNETRSSSMARSTTTASTVVSMHDEDSLNISWPGENDEGTLCIYLILKY
ncbi:unnamed protein product, partial [Rotaria magnacalcarata]